MADGKFDTRERRVESVNFFANLSLRVPMIFSNPRLVREGLSCPHPASLIDIAPTRRASSVSSR
jgi:hypothetical protein